MDNNEYKIKLGRTYKKWTIFRSLFFFDFPIMYLPPIFCKVPAAAGTF